MIEVAAPIWNRIAETQALTSHAANLAFRLNAGQMVEMENLWYIAEELAGTPTWIGRCLPICLPLLIEHLAISQYVANHPTLLGVFPEILDANEAAGIMGSEHRLTAEETDQLAKALYQPQPHLDRWLSAAKQAKTQGEDGFGAKAG